MKVEYIIINKTAIQKRIEKLKSYFKEKQLSNIESVAYNHSILELKEILSQSTPLIPEIEKANELRQPLVSGSVCDGCKFDKKCNLQDQGFFKEMCRHFEQTDR